MVRAEVLRRQTDSRVDVTPESDGQLGGDGGVFEPVGSLPVKLPVENQAASFLSPERLEELRGLVGPDVERSEPPDPEQEWREAARVGRRLADHGLDVIRSFTAYESAPELALWHAPIYLRNENWKYDLVRWTGVLERQLYGSGYFRSVLAAEATNVISV